MSELNLNKFSYQRKTSAFSRDYSNQPCGSTSSNSKSATENCSGNLCNSSETASCSSNEENDDLDPNKDSKCLAGSNFTPQQLADIMEIFPSETRLELVEAITKCGSVAEAVNSVCDLREAKQASCSDDYSDQNAEHSRKKRKRHRFMEDDEDNGEGSKKPRQCEETKNTDSCNSTHSSGPTDNAEVICVSDDDDARDSDIVVSVVDCTDVVDDDSEDEDLDDEKMVTLLSFFNDCSFQELASVPGLSAKKAEKIITMRPFDSWHDLVSRLDSTKNLSSQLIDNCQSLLEERKVVEDLMNQCENISSEIQKKLNLRLNAEDDDISLTSQPKLINRSLQLKPYQLTSLNWLVLMHEQGLNGILADEMGLGKTVQAIAFLAHLCETGEKGPHLIIVPASTLDNWCRETKRWCPSLEFFMYYGSQDERRELQYEWFDREKKPEIVITTYSIAATTDDRSFLRKLNCNYVVLDEGHMLKNMRSQRYQGLMKMKANRRLLLTGTPLQNNLLELMSLLRFVMPHMFGESDQGLKLLFSNSRTNGESGSNYEKATVAQAKRIMKPFVLRRLKKDVLGQLPAKHDHVIKLDLTEDQRQLYNDSFVNCSKRFKQADGGSQYSNILMLLRKAANHPLLLRNHYKDGDLLQMAKKYCKDPAHRDSEPDLVFEDMTVMSDFELHCLCREEQLGVLLATVRKEMIENGKVMDILGCGSKEEGMLRDDCRGAIKRLERLFPLFVYKLMLSTIPSYDDLLVKRLADHCLSKEILIKSGKFVYLDTLLPGLKQKNCRVLLFSQFTMVMDIIEVYLSDRRHRYLRLDGSTSVTDRQNLIDKYNGDPDIFVFLLSTKAGGLGINLTSANVVILHDVDFNPYNDKQAEDRCHRVGQTRSVTVYRLIAKDTIEESILQCAQNKLRLERDMAASDDDDVTAPKDVTQLLSEVFNSS